MTIAISAAREKRIKTIAAEVGETPTAITNKALDLYLEELEDYIDVMKRKDQKTITLKELGKRLGLDR